MTGWLRSCAKSSRRRDAGDTTPVMGWLKADPNDRYCRKLGHATPAIGWLKTFPMNKPLREARPGNSNDGPVEAPEIQFFERDRPHTASSMSALPNESSFREAGHATPAMA